MSTPDPEFPEFDFSCEPVASESIVYDPEKLSENVIWPTVDAKWEGNFRESTVPSMPDYNLPKMGYARGRWLEVSLTAGCFTDYITHETEGGQLTEQTVISRSAEISITESIPGLLAELYEEAVEETQKKEPDSWLAHVGEEGEIEDEFRAAIIHTYSFDEEGHLIFSVVAALEDIDGDSYWEKLVGGNPDAISQYLEAREGDETFDEENFNPVLMTVAQGDIENLLAGMEILGADALVIAYLERIIAYPEAQ